MEKIIGLSAVPTAAASGYRIKKTVTGTDESVLAEFESQDVKLVRGTAIAGRDGRFEFALMVRA